LQKGRQKEALQVKCISAKEMNVKKAEVHNITLL